MLAKWIEGSLTLLGRTTLLGLLVYAAWHFGGVTTTAQMIVAGGSAGLLILAVVVCVMRWKVPMVSPVLPLLGTVFVLYTVGQTQTFVGIFQTPSSPSGFAGKTIGALDEAIAAHRDFAGTEIADSVSSQDVISVVPAMTRVAVVPIVSALALFVCVPIFFDTMRSRQVFWSVVIAHSVAMVCWGFIQRSGHNEFLLPGYPHRLSSIPFASFVYKNAGAAAIIPAIVAVLGFLYFRLIGTDERSSHGYRGSQNYGGSGPFFELRNLTAMAVLMFLIAGLVVSLCRGAWMALAVACIAGLVLGGQRKLPTRNTVLAVASACIVVLAIVWVGGTQQVASDRAKDLSIERVANDSRWSHWPQGARAAIAHLPFGTGLGTYRYATLPYQGEAKRSWFQHAHNQYLEILTETGLPGIAMLIAAIVWMLRCCIKALRNASESTERQTAWIVLVILVAGCLHSVIDFVLIIPANLYLYAAVFGLVFASSSSRLFSDASAGLANSLTERKSSPRISWAMLAALTIIACGTANRAVDRWEIETVLAETSDIEPESCPLPATIDANITNLNHAIENRPHDSRLHRRLSQWKLLQARLAMMRYGQRTGNTIHWKNTQPRFLFASLVTAQPADRQHLVDDLWGDRDFASAMMDSAIHLRNALTLAPHFPNYHLTAAYLSPVLDIPCRDLIESSGALSNNSIDQLYSVGLTAYLSDHPDLAVKYWNRSLSLNLRYFGTIHQLSRHRFSPEVIVSRLTPPRKLTTVLSLLDPLQPEQGPFPESVKQKIGRQVIASLEKRDDVEPAKRFALVGKIHTRLGDDESAVDAWRKSVECDRRNKDYRYEYAVALRRVGQLQEAIDQALLGSAIGADDSRFERLVKELRRQISPSPLRIRPASYSVGI